MGGINGEKRVANEILVALYEAYYAQALGLMNDEVRQAAGWSSSDFSDALDSLEETGLASLRTSGPCYEITVAGILHAERNGLVTPDVVKQHDTVRTQILSGFAVKAKPPNDDRRYVEVLEPIKARFGADATWIERDLELLFDDDCGCLEGTSMGSFRLTRKGRAVVEDWKKRQGMEDAMKALHASENPQNRGRQFQKLFAELARHSGWEVDESVLAVGEETDVLLTRGSEILFVECRWKKDPSKASELRDFLGKLELRYGARGAFVAMAGYTEGAAETVSIHNNSGSNPVVLYGPKDVESLFSGGANFAALLSAKALTLLKKREAVWE